jgi:hypothetical protein
VRGPVRALTALLILAVAAAGTAFVADATGILPNWLAGSDVVDAASGRGVLEGWVKDVDTAHGVLHVTRGLLPFSVTPVLVDRQTDIRVRDKIGTIRDLHVGVAVKVCYDVQGETRAARTVDVHSASGPCQVAVTQPVEQPAAAEPIAATPAGATTDQPPAVPAPASRVRATSATMPAASIDPTPVKHSDARPPKPSKPRASEATEATAPSRPAPLPAPSPARPVPARGDASDDAHDYGAVVDWVLRR